MSELLSNEIIKQSSKLYLVYIFILSAEIISTIVIYKLCKKNVKSYGMLLLISNTLLTFAMLIGCMRNVLIVDVLGMDIYNAVNPINRKLLVIFYVAGVICIIDLIIIIRGKFTCKKTNE